jgi:hypothetical protein
MAANNFISEIPKFFLKNSNLTTITSNSEDEYTSMISGSTYYMDVILYPENNFKMIKSFHDGIRTDLNV